MAAVSAPSITNKTSSNKSKYRPEIDGLRAFAVVAVIINHFNKDLLPSGYLGVDIFFVISGYVITSSLAGRESKNFLDFLTGFYERRIKRLVPALVVFVLITSIFICFFNPDPTLALRTGATSLFGFSNLYLLRQSTDYFAQSTELNPFTHTWSLGVEEQFYLLFPFLIWFSGFGQQTAKGARNLFFWVGALTVASLISFIYLYQINQPAAYFLMPPRFWEMAAGCLIFIGFQKRAKIEQVLEQVPPLLVVAAMVGVMFLPTEAAVPATISIVALSAVLIACLKTGTAGFVAFTNNRVVYIGLISYSLYLWHWGILAISRWSIGVHWWSVPFQLAAMVGMASATYRWIEKPVRQFYIGPRLIAIGSGGAASFALSAFVGLFMQQSGLSRLAYVTGGALQGHTRWRGEDNSIIHTTLTCRDGDLDHCLKRNSGKKVIYVIGDSHAENHLPSISRAVRDLNLDYSIKNWWSYALWRDLQAGDSEYNKMPTGYKQGIYDGLEMLTSKIKTESRKGDLIVFGWWRNRILVPVEGWNLLKGTSKFTRFASL
jgi:peptidoglycan/LPS O-acetylase OafA/YrhL